MRADRDPIKVPQRFSDVGFDTVLSPAVVLQLLVFAKSGNFRWMLVMACSLLG